MATSANPLRKRKKNEATTRKATPEEETRNTDQDPPRKRDTSRTQREWTREDFFADLYKASARIASEITANAEEVASLKRSQRDIEEGRVHWEDEEDGGGEA